MNVQILSKLLGRWQVDQNDRAALARYGNVQLEFRSDGMLIYTIVGAAKDEVALLRFRIEEAVIVTDQPSAPREERTRFRIDADGRLFLDDADGGAYYTRIRGNEPDSSS
jgi:hypothetical protein